MSMLRTKPQPGNSGLVEQACCLYWIRHRIFLLLFCSLCPINIHATAEEETTGLLPPAEMTSFTTYITEGGVLRQQVSAERARLYQELGVVYLRGIHVDFFEKETALKDTLEAPEGYLYLRDYAKDAREDKRIGPTFPFYKQIGGKEANIDLLTTTTRLVGGLPDMVVRHRNDIDLIGTANRKVVSCRSDGSIATCLRAYRDAKRAMLYGVGDVELRGLSAEKNQHSVMKGRAFVSDDRLRNISIRGEPTIKSGKEGQ